MKKREPINSEYIEPYLKDFLMLQIESIAYGLSSPSEVKAELKAVQYFISAFGGLHSQFAVNNEYDRFCNLSDIDLITICKKVHNISPCATPSPKSAS